MQAPTPIAWPWRAVVAAAIAAGLAGCGNGHLSSPDADVDAVEAGDDADAPGPGPVAGEVCVLLDPGDAERSRASGVDFFAEYVTEIFAHAGIEHVAVTRDELAAAAPGCAVLVVPYDAPLGPGSAVVDRFVREGGTLIAMAGTSGLDDLLGLESTGQALAEGYADFSGGAGLFEPPPQPLHLFDVVPASVSTAEVIARALDVGRTPTGRAAVARNVAGAGEAWYLGYDHAATVVTIQQGRPVTTEPIPELADGILKTDDGAVLDWALDRGEVDGQPLFLEPVVDWLNELLLSVTLRGVARAGGWRPVLWYWPDALFGVGVISHDTDGNQVDNAAFMLDRLAELDVRSTWCFIREPGPYPAAVYADVAAAGHEVSLHYDAWTPGGYDTVWALPALLEQLAWLEGLAGVDVTTNKNHGLRWEGWADFYRWCEIAGITAEQSRGPSAAGATGFLFGTSHPHFPVDDAAHGNRRLDVLSIDHLSWDPIVWFPPELAAPLLERVARHHGVAHFLFHPWHIQTAGVADELAAIVGLARDRGMEWWTVADVDRWERARRRVRVLGVDEAGFRLYTPEPLEAVTLLVVVPPGGVLREVEVAGVVVGWTHVVVFGVPAVRFTVDLPAGETAVALAR